MNRWVRGAIALGMGFSLTLVAIQVEESSVEETVPAGTQLGPIDLAGFCRHEYGDRASLIHPNGGAYGWVCWARVKGILNPHGIDADRACELTYGAPVYAEVLRIDDPFGWVCVRGPRTAK